MTKNKYDFTDRGPDSVKQADREQGKADAEYWQKEMGAYLARVTRWGGSVGFAVPRVT